MAERFRGYLPVVVDVETGGFDDEHDALLEIAAIPLAMDEGGRLRPHRPCPRMWSRFPVRTWIRVAGNHRHRPVQPAARRHRRTPGAGDIFHGVREAMREAGCQRAILVGHNAAFDLGFLNQAVCVAATSATPSTRSAASTR